MHEIDIPTFAAAHAAGAAVVDVRQPAEYVAGHVPGARSVPLASIPDTIDDLRAMAPLYVVCASGVRSLAATEALAAAGIEAYSVAGGTNAWQAQGRRVVRGRHPEAG